MTGRGGERPRRPDRYALLEMRALVERIIQLRDAGGRQRYFADDDHRWLIHRLWIGVGNEAVAYACKRRSRFNGPPDPVADAGIFLVDCGMVA